MAQMAKRVVCVTGASGFLASWLIKGLLERGYHVRGTVRDPENVSKVAHLWELPGAKERLQLLKADLVTEGIFDSIVEGCQGVFHIASPGILFTNDPQSEIVDPALKGTLNVLKACKKSSTVKRVVYTSSTAAVQFSDGMSPDQVVDESFWSSVEFCREHKLWYPLSKTLAEQAAWDFARANNLDLVTVAPSVVVGTLLAASASSSAANVLQLLKGDKSIFEADIFQFIGYVHLDDVVSAHILVYEDQNANGRYLCSAFNATNVEISTFLAKRFPQYNVPTDFTPRDIPYKGFSHKRLEELGIRFKSMEQMFDDCVHSFQHNGLI